MFYKFNALCGHGRTPFEKAYIAEDMSCSRETRTTDTLLHHEIEFLPKPASRFGKARFSELASPEIIIRAKGKHHRLKRRIVGDHLTFRERLQRSLF
jgi:hypothetical protein